MAQDGPRGDSLGLRVLFMILTCAGVTGLYFGYNIVGATAPMLQVAPIGFSATQVGGLMSAYSLPNWIMPFFAGEFSDTYGHHVAAGVFSGLLTIGALIVFVSLNMTDVEPHQRYMCTVTGMIIFGIGGESLTVALKGMLSVWFADAQVFPQFAFACGLILTFAYGSTFLCRWSMPHFAETHLPTAYLISACVCGLTCASVIVAGYLYGYRDDMLASQPQRTRSPTIISRVRSLPRQFFVVACMLSLASGMYACNETFWTDVLVSSWGFTTKGANALNSMTCWVCLPLVPACGAFYDKFGRRVLGSTLGCIILSFAWAGISTTQWHVYSATPVVATVCVGIGAALLFGGLWAVPPLLVPRSHVGLAFGTMTAMQNVFLSIELVTAGYIKDLTGTYDASGIFIGSLGIASAIIGIGIHLSGRFTDGPCQDEASRMQTKLVKTLAATDKLKSYSSV